MNLNPLYYPTLLLAFGAFALGTWGMARVRGTGRRMALIGVAIILAIPGLLYTLAYARFFENAVWFNELRALPGSELLAAGVGLLPGMLYHFTRGKRLLGSTAVVTLLVLLFYWVSVPYVKMLTSSAVLQDFSDEWQDGVCRQSTGSSCGPASAATLARLAGVEVSERMLAHEAFTSMSGTENWYLARALRHRGLRVWYQMTPPNPEHLPYPSMAGTRLGEHGAGHFIAILGETSDAYIIGDPLAGRATLVKAHRARWHYHFTGFFIRVER